jgi:MinD superfamily P-loop ATPase
MIITVASGKGGTGKTSITAALAQSFEGKICVADCDVEEPNAHMLLHPKFYDEKTVSVKKPVLDESKCTGCRQCVDVCHFNAISFLDGKPVFFEHLCHSCGGCVLKCKENAIGEKDIRIGKIKFGRKENIDIISGELDIGQAMSPPLIAEVLREAKKHPFVIADAAAGNSCPMVEAAKESDFCLLVTEPTPFGIHDFKIAVDILRRMGKPFAAIINRSDICSGSLNDFCAAEKIKVMLEIPFSRKIAEGYSKGQSLIDAEPQYKQKFAKILEDIFACNK